MHGTRGCVVAGVIGLGLGGWGVIRWWPLTLTILKGVVPLALLLGGVIALVAALLPSDVHDLESPSGKPPHAL